MAGQITAAPLSRRMSQKQIPAVEAAFRGLQLRAAHAPGEQNASEADVGVNLQSHPVDFGTNRYVSFKVLFYVFV